MSFTAEKKYFSGFLKARGSNSLVDMMELGILPKIKGLYRRDYAKHMNWGGDEETEIDAILLTHAHVDHCGYLEYIRPEIPIYCSEESKIIMQNFDDTGVGSQYITMKEKFQFHKSEKGLTKDQMVKNQGDSVKIPRKIIVFKKYEKFKINSIEVEPLPVDHSISGVYGFILYTSEGIIVNTADLRFHGRRKDDTERFVEKCGNVSPDLLLCEGTRIEKTSSITEYDIEDKLVDVINNTEKLVICGYPIRDLDRLQSIYLAAKRANRYLAIEPRQAYLLKLFNESENLKGIYPDPKDENIKIYFAKETWGLIDKDINVYTRKLLDADYRSWAREFLDYSNKIDHRDVSKNQNEIIISLSDFKLQELIDIKPDENSCYVRSLTEPFDGEMLLQQEKIKNWFAKFGLISSEKNWHQIHVSGHGDGTQIKKVIDGVAAKKIIPIHTDPKNEIYHKKWHNNVQSVNMHDMIYLK